MMTGALNTGVDIFSDPSGILAGLPFAATLLGILFTHEMGHYIVGRLRHAPVSLPYFIPMPPFISFIGTMGAVIVQREPMEDRRDSAGDRHRRAAGRAGRGYPAAALRPGHLGARLANAGNAGAWATSRRATRCSISR